MKVCLKNISKTHISDSIDVVKDFCQFLQDKLKLKDDVYIDFTNVRKNGMTTGLRMPKNTIEVLTKGRLLIDIFRTLSHEWVHEYQCQIMGVPEDEPIQDIGGPEENMASVLSSIFIKKFQKQFPQHQEKLYSE